MPPMRRLARDKAAIESLASAIDEENINRHEPHGSQGSDDHIVKIMVDALKKSVIPNKQNLLYSFHSQLMLRIDQEAKRCSKKQDSEGVRP